MTFSLELTMGAVREFQQYFGYWIESIYHLSGHVDVTGKDVARACFLAHDPWVLIRHTYITSQFFEIEDQQGFEHDTLIALRENKKKREAAAV